jgi:hypothetical protein
MVLLLAPWIVSRDYHAFCTFRNAEGFTIHSRLSFESTGDVAALGTASVVLVQPIF